MLYEHDFQITENVLNCSENFHKIMSTNYRPQYNPGTRKRTPSAEPGTLHRPASCRFQSSPFKLTSNYINNNSNGNLSPTYTNNNNTTVVNTNYNNIALSTSNNGVAKSVSSIPTPTMTRSASFSKKIQPPPQVNVQPSVPSYRFHGIPLPPNAQSTTPTSSIAPVNFNSNKNDPPRRLNFRSSSSNNIYPPTGKTSSDIVPRENIKKEKPSKNFISYGIQQFAVGHSDTMGRRPSMEDTCVSYGEFAGIGTQYYAIFDGHGGPEVSAYCAANLHQLIADYYNNGNSFAIATKKAIKCVNDYVVDKWPQAGSTAAIAIIDDDVLFTANVGDSRIILIHNGKAKRLSVDHKAVLPDESDAIIRRGGTIQSGRVNGILMLSRAIGDGTVAKYISSEPFMTQTILKDNARLILACDGVWDVMDDQYAADIFLQIRQPEEAAIAIKEEAMRRGTMDNVSVICVNLKVNI